MKKLIIKDFQKRTNKLLTEIQKQQKIYDKLAKSASDYVHKSYKAIWGEK